MTNNSRAMFTSNKPDWETPRSLFDKLNTEFGFTLDVCATPSNAKCIRFFSPEDDGLTQPWAKETCWMNPPYGKGMDRWIIKAHTEATLGATVVALVPARVEMGWFHEHVLGSAEIRFLRGRLRFVGAPYNAPFASMVIVWRPS